MEKLGKQEREALVLEANTILDVAHQQKATNRMGYPTDPAALKRFNEILDRISGK